MSDRNGNSNTDDRQKQQQKQQNNNNGVKNRRSAGQCEMSPRGEGGWKAQLEVEKARGRALRNLPLGTTWSTTTLVTSLSKVTADTDRHVVPLGTTISTTIPPNSSKQNFVSPTISKNSNNPTRVTGVQPVIGDFPSFMETEESTSTGLSRGTYRARLGSSHTIDASKTLIEGESHVGESKLTPTKKISATTGIRKSVTRCRLEPKTPAVPFESKSTENKCHYEAAGKVSNQREPEANGCAVNAEARPSAQIENTRAVCGPRAYPKTSQGLYGLSTANQSLSLAARKAKLRAEFFAKDDDEAHGLDYIKELIGVKSPTVLSSSSESIEAASIRSVAQGVRYWNNRLSRVKVAPTDIAVLRRGPISPKLVDRMKIFGQMIGNTRGTRAASTELLNIKPAMLEHRNSPLSDEGCNLGHSPYSSDNEDNESTNTTIERIAKRKEKVARSASSDSALGLDVDEPMDTTPSVPPTGPQPRRMTLTVTDLPLRPALLPLAEPTALPEVACAPLADMSTPTVVPSKVLIEERVVELPEPNSTLPCSRRESSQSCLSDYPNSECSGVRYVRTPSVVVSDYSDEVLCGITLEEIEYFRAQRMRRRCSSLDTAGTEKDGDNQSDVSASSSCSNLYYCGSTISALDGNECFVNGMPLTLQRKSSDCSNCSVSADEDTGYTIREEQPEDLSSSAQQINKDLSELLAAQHLSAVQQQQQRNVAGKKVGLLAPFSGPTMAKSSYEP